MTDNNQPPANRSPLERALAGEYQFNIRQQFAEAQSLYKQHLGLLLKATGLLMAIGLGAMVVMINLLALDMTSVESMQSGNASLLDIAMLVLMTPLIVGFRMLGVKLVSHKATNINELFQYFPYILVLVTANLLISLVMQVGLNLLILPGLAAKPSGVATSSTRWFSHKPLLSRKVLRPDSADTPAPVNTTTRGLYISVMVNLNR